MTHRLELVVAFAFLGLILFGFYLIAGIDLAFSSDLEALSGPRAYPAMILGLMLLANLGVIASLLLTGNTDKAASDAEPPFGRGTLDAGIVLAALVVFVIVFEPLGYLLTMIPLLVVTSMMNGARNWLTTTVISTLMALTCLAVFRYGLNTVLPEGILGIDMIL